MSNTQIYYICNMNVDYNLYFFIKAFKIKAMIICHKKNHHFYQRKIAKH